MGSERWLRFSSVKEADKCKEYLGATTEIGVDGKWGCWLTWTKPTILWVGTQAGSLDFSALVCREIAKRFAIRAIGSDSAGWYLPTDGLPFHGCATWPEWIKTYSAKRDNLCYDFYSDEEWDEQDNFVSEKFWVFDTYTTFAFNHSTSPNRCQPLPAKGVKND